MNKLLKVFVSLLLFFMVYALCLGAFGNFQQITTVVVNAPVVKAWEYMDKMENMKEWLKTDDFTFVEGKLIEGEENEIGSKSELIFDRSGMEVRMIETLTVYEPYERVAFNIKDEQSHFEMEIEYEDLGDQTRITETNTAGEETAFFTKITIQLFKGRINEQKRQMYNQLKAAIESK